MIGDESARLEKESSTDGALDLFDLVVASAFDDAYPQPAVGPNLLVLYRLALSEQYRIGPNGEIYLDDD